MKFFSNKILQKYVNDGLLTVRKHPDKNLYVYNYTPKCSFSRAWDKITLACRGLILDDDCNIIGRPFNKFFNHNELDFLQKYLNEKPLYIQEKLDGSLGILFNYKGTWDISTRGSFTSDQANWAREFLKNYKLEYLDSRYTYMVEIIYPENRIVVDYADELKGLYLLCAINTEDNTELEIKVLSAQAELSTLELASFYEFDNLQHLIEFMAKSEITNAEGFVLTYENNFKLKIKYQKYLQLHRAISNLTDKTIWECLYNNTENEFLSLLPDEFYELARTMILDLKSQFNILYKTIIDIFNLYKDLDRKEFAISIQHSNFKAALFEKYDNKNITKTILKYLKP